ncbi:unnamed protein product, partial [marine sediment metagenome]
GRKLSDKDILRASIMAELDAINLYEGFADVVRDKDIKKVLLDVAREEKVHVGEFQEMLLREDEEHRSALYKGIKEVDELFKK